MHASTSLIDSIDPEIQSRLLSRKDILFGAAKKLGAAATVPAVVAVASTEALGQGLPGSVADILNFALTLEYLEAQFYATALSTPGLIPGRYRAVFSQIGLHEKEHVETLLAALGPAATGSPRFDYTGKGMFPDVFSNFNTFTTVSSTFEDLGVAAYKGQAGNLMGTAALSTALRIHSVEARHAAEVRRVRGLVGFDGPLDAPKNRIEVLLAAAPFLA